MDPARALDAILTDVEQHGQLDPKLQAAIKLLQEHLRPFATANPDVLGTALWSYARPTVQGAHLKVFRAWLDDGAVVLRAVESATGTFLAASVLDEVVRESTTMLAGDSASMTDAGRAHGEVQRLLSTDIAPLVVLAGILIYDVYMETTEGYVWYPPPPPPPPPPPYVGKEVMHS